jgi:hypothetical protein
VVASQPLRLGAAVPQHVADGRGDDPIENRASFCDLEKLIDRIERAASTLGRADHADAHEAIDILVWEGIEDDRVDHAVDGRGGHHSGGQGDDGQGRHRLGLDQVTRPEADIPPELLQPECHGRLRLA